MYEIKSSGFAERTKRLVSDTKLTPEEFREIAAVIGGGPPIRARKLGHLAAYRADDQHRVPTQWQDEDTVNIAEPGDWIVIRLNKEGTAPDTDDNGKINTYVVKDDAFMRSNRRVGELEIRHPMIYPDRALPVFQGTATVDALYFSGGVDIIAPWGQRQSFGEAAYLLLNRDEVYGNAKASFEADYEVLD